MTTRIVGYPGSFDPMHNGHINVIERAARLYDKVVVIVAVDDRKKYMFTIEEKVSIAKEATAHLPNVSVDTQ
jgi:pantetheine-phosphate adenylyltransferase